MTRTSKYRSPPAQASSGVRLKGPRLSMRSGEGMQGRRATRLHPRSLDSLTDSSVDGCVVIVRTCLEEHVRLFVGRVREE